MTFASFAIQALQLITLTVVLAASALLSARLFGHAVSVGCICLFSVHNIKYSHNTTLTISCSCARFAFHIPRPSNPRWGSFTAYDYDYSDTVCRVSVAKLHADLWIFPKAFKHTAGPWTSVELHDFRLLVISSKTFPGWVAGLRRNLVNTILSGEYLRLDDFKTSVVLGPDATSGADRYDQPVEKPVIEDERTEPDDDEARVSASARHFHVRNWQGRNYMFGAIDAQLRRSWVDDRGSFVMIAENSVWAKVQSPEERQITPLYSWRQIPMSILYFPSDLAKLYFDPLSFVDLHIPRADITFDDFRMRDAELVRQCGEMVARKFNEGGKELTGFLWDVFLSALLELTG
ncbi:hypothetical protein PLICRDRAFT_153850 [Plicaturopsis crispa FD-325 SS-3]|nr:hypothetical protein PLICRDRAFT_153850 [Plicaturopsis crispa FD-325 SS-3]